ncbi:MAG TPA: hypothetical protein PLO37_04980 [Candidatus Hydrogenedentes bacterium]|nr:hypothetical protein [Candidatus Hydrogenedentota bacterium]HPG66179.1 hypothetical protein [Candidatus Hydrogenedentota bacterium]
MLKDAAEEDVLLDRLLAYDAELTKLDGGDGCVLVCPGLQGRIFCLIGDELIHRLDIAALESPSPTEFNNLGGNSLWPAPEGGPFAFNYPPDGGPWRVQKAIGEDAATLVYRDDTTAVMEKRIDLTNRKGVQIEILYRRAVSVPTPEPPLQEFDLAGLTYRTEDSFEPLGSYATNEVLLAPWSLEQFPGAEGVLAFCKVRRPETAVNEDFYGRPEGRIAFGQGHFTFALGGQDRHQIGVRVASAPEYIGALDANRSMLMLRRTEPQRGVYFNIADNDQADGPYSAADCYSMFNGGALGFFELETVGAMQVAGEYVAASTLVSETILLKGRMEELLRYLAERESLRLNIDAL